MAVNLSAQPRLDVPPTRYTARLNKLYRIRLALRGESYTWLQFFNRDQAEEFVVALTDAIDVAFPRNSPPVHLGGPGATISK
jgi:hypothetical protein